MEGRRALDKKFFFGFPSELDPNLLPTDSDIVSHTQYLKREKNNSGEWKHNTPVSVIARVVANDVCSVWDKTEIPHLGTKNPKRVRENVEKVLNKAKGFLKIPVERRDNVDLEGQWSKLFDISLCPHREKSLCLCPNCKEPHPEPCDCSADTAVPACWREFLWDQRDMRQQCLSTIDRQKMKRDMEKMKEEQRTLLRNNKDNESLDKARRKSQIEIETWQGAAADVELVDSQGDRLSYGGDDTEEDSDDEMVETEGPKFFNYNTVNLRRFSRECDATMTSNRGGAKIANALLKDLGYVTETDQTLLICPSKLKREREKWGKERVGQHSSNVTGR